MQASVAEVYSPPRVTKAATVLPELGIRGGSALDITTRDEEWAPWDLSKPDRCRKAERLLDEEDPDLLVGSPMCVAFSAWQRMNRITTKDPEAFRKRREEAVKHMEFVRKLYEKQVRKREVLPARAPCAGGLLE